MALGDKEIQAVLKAIDDGLITFNEALPQIESNIYKRLLRFQRELSVQGETITNSAANIRMLSQLQSDLEQIILSDSGYGASVEKLVKLFSKVDALNFAYFKVLEKKFKPPKLIEEVRKQSISLTINGLTESGIDANIINPLRQVINTYVTTGGSYAELSKELNNYITGTPEIDGALSKYAKLYATDAINQYVSTVNSITSADLGWKWFKYVGSNIKTTRTFCKALTQKKFYHKSELPRIIKGDFEEFRQMKGKIYDRTGLPQGLIEDTNPSNFQTYRGGYNCGHQAYPIPNIFVPKELLSKFANN